MTPINPPNWFPFRESPGSIPSFPAHQPLICLSHIGLLLEEIDGFPWQMILNHHFFKPGIETHLFFYQNQPKRTPLVSQKRHTQRTKSRPSEASRRQVRNQKRQSLKHRSKAVY